MNVVVRIFRRFSWNKISRLKLLSFCVLFPVAAVVFLAAGSLLLYQRDISILSLALAGGAGILLLVARSEPN